MLHLASGERGAFSVGGMASKLRAVKALRRGGRPNRHRHRYRHPAQLAAIVAGGGRCTRFLPQAR
ncbi:MAG: hypothetical protein R3F11_32525 [Verrucomicrobiales bacterium]